jgi:hypothetical protein
MASDPVRVLADTRLELAAKYLALKHRITASSHAPSPSLAHGDRTSLHAAELIVNASDLELYLRSLHS